MLAKLIKCSVPTQHKTKFSEGQRHWQQTKQADGFIKQSGGWVDDTAVILALWKDKVSVQHFMQSLHDPIADRANQVSYSSSISVYYLKHIMDIPSNSNSLKARPKLIRLAEYVVDKNRVEEFLEKQQSVWNGRLTSAEGMIAGHVWQYDKESNRLPVSTYWESEQAYYDHLINYFPELEQRASPENHMQTLDECIINMAMFELTVVRNLTD